MWFLLGRLLAMGTAKVVQMTPKQIVYKVVLTSGKVIFVTVKIIGAAIVGMFVSQTMN
jgi:hypothetical protein